MGLSSHRSSRASLLDRRYRRQRSATTGTSAAWYRTLMTGNNAARLDILAVGVGFEPTEGESLR